jgi:hypothetical protein
MAPRPKFVLCCPRFAANPWDLSAVRRLVIFFWLQFCVVPALVLAVDLSRGTLLVDLDDRQVEGSPLAWSREHLFLLGRDGQLLDIVPKASLKYRKTSSYFSSLSHADMRGALEREFAGQLEVTATGHYLVAHPFGKGQEWAAKFEVLYRSCVNYFTLHGLRVHEPDFPLVAIVWPNHDAFQRHAAPQGLSSSANVLGFYSPVSNRVNLYDQASGGNNKRVWRENEATIIHEATHQMAFNIGVHNRFSVTPKWLAEGLGTMFEARGVWDWRNYPQLTDRINHDRLRQFRQWQKSSRPATAFASLLASDRAFQSNPSAAYAESWAWVLFLTETYPQKFSQYVQRTAERPNFEEYPLARRVADFTAVFGEDLRLLDSHFLRWIAALE